MLDAHQADLTEQEILFLKRVALKLEKNPLLKIPAAMQQVCDDDKRIFEAYLTMPMLEQAALLQEFAGAVYRSINRKTGTR